MDKRWNRRLILKSKSLLTILPQLCLFMRDKALLSIYIWANKLFTAHIVLQWHIKIKEDTKAQRCHLDTPLSFHPKSLFCFFYGSLLQLNTVINQSQAMNLDYASYSMDRIPWPLSYLMGNVLSFKYKWVLPLAKFLYPMKFLFHLFCVQNRTMHLINLPFVLLLLSSGLFNFCSQNPHSRVSILLLEISL